MTNNSAVRNVDSYPSHSSRPQQALVKRKQRFVDLKNVILFLPNKILNNHIELAAGAEGVACAGDEVAGLVQIQLQSDGEGNGRGFGGFVVRIISDFGEQLAVNVGLFIDLGVLFSAFVNELQQGCLLYTSPSPRD